MSNQQQQHVKKRKLYSKCGIKSLVGIQYCYFLCCHEGNVMHTASAFTPGPAGSSSTSTSSGETCQGLACHRPRNGRHELKKKRHHHIGNDGPFGNNNNNSNNKGRGENFATQMARFNHEQQLQEEQQDIPTKKEDELHSDHHTLHNEGTIQERRIFLATLFATATTAAAITTNEPANAFEKAYPVNLDFDNDDTTINLQSIRQERISVKKSQAKQVKSDLISQPFQIKTKEDVIASVVWGGSLWLLLGSRSNPLVKPFANLLYDENTQEGAWVKDRNEGLFAPLPAAFMLIMGVVFLILGFITDRGLLLLTDENSNSVLQLAGVSLIGGASLELGRIASGEKMITREDLERETMLADEFREFASKRLIFGEGGSVHRSEVITSFRRFFAKYRVENDQYPLNDLEIERLLKSWNQREGNEERVTSAGFLKDVKINDQAILK
jgi:hypothetical protein